ncbi:MAG: DUF3443 domain-containing protein [Aquincola sp.]|nr:DUF3443 domain-containing protein [Aquincola sp.]MDH5331172.1 DUF3443 domain-containing protein [Aquincola sp.]
MRAFAGAFVLAVVAVLSAGCGGGTTSTTTVTCRDPNVCVADEVVLQNAPTGPNTTEIVVDSGPSGGFVLGVTNVPYVSVTVCQPGTSQCATIDHVLLDSGSYGLRVLKSKVASLGLAPVDVAADAASGTPAGTAAECYAFVLGAVWGPLARADVRIADELAPDISIQLIDDGSTKSPSLPANCQSNAQGGLLDSVTQLQANGILGIGMIGVDCGVSCLTSAYPGGYVVYYSCPPSGAACQPAGLPSSTQVRNPVTAFAVNNNGTMVVMPPLPELGAKVARGRLVFGIGTQSNNQLPQSARMYQVQTDPFSANYLYVGLDVAGRAYPQSFIDTGSNALFFSDPGISKTCNVSSGGAGGWYCPTSTWRQSGTLTDMAGMQGSFDLAVGNADTLFTIGAAAFSNLGGDAGQGAETFSIGMPFFYGRTVFTSIWQQRLAENGPWYAF